MAALLPVDPSRGILIGGNQTRNPALFAVPNGLVGYWGLDPDCLDFTQGMAFDLSGNGNTGTLIGTPPPTAVIGVVGNALTFARTSHQYVNCGPISALSGATKFSIAAWMMRSAANKTTLFGQGNGTSAYSSCELWNDGNIYFELSLSDGHASLPGTDWHHIVMVFDGSQSGNSARLTGYAGGVKLTLAFNGTIPAASSNTGTDPFTIGRYLNNASVDSDGSIDDIRIYNRALDPWEVTALYQAGLAGRRDAGRRVPAFGGMGVLGGLARPRNHPFFATHGQLMHR